MMNASTMSLDEGERVSAKLSNRALAWTAAALARAQHTMRSPWRRFGFASAALTAAFVLRSLADPVLPSGFPFLTFFPAVVLTTFIAGVRTGVASGVISAFLAWYFFIPPFYSFHVNGGVGVAVAFYGFVLAIDIALIAVMQKAIDRLSREEKRSAELAAQRELLFQELQHRVANNLAMISGLLNVQRRIVEDQEAKQALAQAASRITLIGQIQRALHDPQRQQFDLGAHVERLTRDLMEAAGAKSAWGVKSEALLVPGERATLLSLIAAELITNALKHGIGERADGRLEIELRHAPLPGWGVLSVHDDGPGMGADSSERHRRSLGMQIVHNLARQLGATIAFANGDGMTATLQFPIEQPSAPKMGAAA